MVFQYPLELLDTYLHPKPALTAEESTPQAATPAPAMSTVSRAPSQMGSSHRTSTARPGNGHFSTTAPSEISRAGYFSNSATPRGEVRSRTKVVTSQESEHTVYDTKSPRGPGPHGSRLSSDAGSRPTHIQAYTAADIAAGLCPNPPPRPNTPSRPNPPPRASIPGAPRREGTKGSTSNVPSLASTADGDTSSERRERTRNWVSYAPSQSSTTNGVLGLGRRPSIGSMRGPVFQNPGLGATPRRTSQRQRASDPRARQSASDLHARQSLSDQRARQSLSDLRARQSSSDLRARQGSSDPRAAAAPSMVYGGAGEAPGRRGEPSLPRRSGGGESGRTLKSAMKGVGTGERGKSVKFAKEKSTKYYHGAGN